MTITNILIAIGIFALIATIYERKKSNKNQSLMNKFNIKKFFGKYSEYGISEIDKKPFLIEIYNKQCIKTEIKSLNLETKKRIEITNDGLLDIGKKSATNRTEHLIKIVLVNDRTIIESFGLKIFAKKIEDAYLEIIYKKT